MRELFGHRHLTYPEATQILGQRIGGPDLRYIQVSENDIARMLEQAGMSQSFANLFVEMTRIQRGKDHAESGSNNRKHHAHALRRLSG